MVRISVIAAAAGCFGLVNAHLAAWHKGMYCINGPQNEENLNSYDIVTPLYQLEQKDWFLHHVTGCDQYPPPEGEFLEIPAGGQFTVEIASNRAKTTLSYNGRYTSDWPDGSNYPDDYNVPTCIISPNMHTQNESMAAGTAFAISYVSDIKQVTPENLAVFSIKYHTPWKRVTTYDVPAAMPPCPDGGCICAWGWVPDGCGQANIYHQPFKCKVTGSTSNTPIAKPKPPVWCQDDQSKCVKGAKQMISWNQLSGQNVFVDGFDLQGEHKSPAYNTKCGFADGAQNDIFEDSDSSNSPSPPKPSSPATGKTRLATPPQSSSAPESTSVSSGSSSSSSPSSPARGTKHVAAPPKSSSTPESTPNSTPESAPESTPGPSPTSEAKPASTSSSSAASTGNGNSSTTRKCRHHAAHDVALQKKAATQVKVHHNHRRDLNRRGRWVKSRRAGDA